MIRFENNFSIVMFMIAICFKFLLSTTLKVALRDCVNLSFRDCLINIRDCVVGNVVSDNVCLHVYH